MLPPMNELFLSGRSEGVSECVSELSSDVSSSVGSFVLYDIRQNTRGREFIESEWTLDKSQQCNIDNLYCVDSSPQNSFIVTPSDQTALSEHNQVDDNDYSTHSPEHLWSVFVIQEGVCEAVRKTTHL
jgi:hypothetical protein